MKYFLTLTFALFLFSAPTLAAEDNEVATEVPRDIVITVDGMVCDFCAQSLTKVFKKEDSINAISVDLDNKWVIVDTVNAPESLSDEKIKELIDWAGYDLVQIERAAE